MFTLPLIATSYFKKKLRFATLWGEIGMSGVLLLHKKVSIMENNETKKKKRVYKLKFDQLWIDAINQIPVYYHSEIYYWLDYYQNHNYSDIIGTMSDDLVRSLFMLIYPTIKRRRIARNRQRKSREIKKAARLAAPVESQQPAQPKKPEEKTQPEATVKPTATTQPTATQPPEAAAKPQPAPSKQESRGSTAPAPIDSAYHRLQNILGTNELNYEVIAERESYNRAWPPRGSTLRE